MGRMFKPNLTPTELAMINGLGDRVAAGLVSQSRGANLGSISQAEASRRRVSHEWVRKQRRQTIQPPNNSEVDPMTQPPNNSSVTDYTGPRMEREETSEAVWGRALLKGHVHAFGVDEACRCGAKPSSGNQPVNLNKPEPGSTEATVTKVVAE